MFCSKCGKENDDNAFRCIQCNEVLHHEPMEKPGPAPVAAAAVTVPNYLVQAILATLFCCLPLGIPAIVFAAQVNGKVAAGDVTGALDASKKARLFCWLSFGLGLTGGIIYIFIMVLGAVFAR